MIAIARGWQRLGRRPGTRLALIVLTFVSGIALGAPLLPLPHYGRMDHERHSQPPSPEWRVVDTAGWELAAREHPVATRVRGWIFGDAVLRGALGTDALGRDVLGRVVWGARVSLLVGLVATLVSMIVGVSWGLVAGYFGGRTDQIMMRVVDALYAVPFLFLVILIIALLRSVSGQMRQLGIDRLVVLFVAIGAVSWLTMARIVRGQVLSLRQRDFIHAATALGASSRRILLVHLLPNLWGLVTVYLTLTVPRVMLFEAFLSFLGLGVEPPGVSWGILASEGIESLTAIGTAWWLIVFPGTALALTLGALNVLGDGLRDLLDPRTAAAGVRPLA